jgi:D-proline reductase (dithiol) PrdB
MCHQSAALLSNALEEMGLSTILITLQPWLTSKVGIPRGAYLRFPLGNPVGEPFRADLQRRILIDTLTALKEIKNRGTIVELPYRWRRGRTR